MIKFGHLEAVTHGEDSRHQFKRDATNADGLAAELVAFANSSGGWLLLSQEGLKQAPRGFLKRLRRLFQRFVVDALFTRRASLF